MVTGPDAVKAEDIWEYLNLLRRRWRVLCFSILICLTAGIYHLATLRPVHEATVRLLVIAQGTRPAGVGVSEAVGVNDTLLDPVPTHMEIIRSPLVTRPAVQRLADAAAAKGRATAITSPVELSGRLKVSQPDRESRIIRVGYQAPTAAEAVETLEAITESYETYLKERYLSKNEQLTSLLNRAKDEVRGELVALEKAYLELRQSQINAGIVVDDKGRPVVSGRLADWARGMDEALHRTVQLESQMELGRDLSREGFGFSAIVHAIDLMGDFGRGKMTGGTEFASDAASERLSAELEDVELRVETTDRLVKRLEAQEFDEADPVHEEEVEQAVFDDPEVSGLRAELKAVTKRQDTARRLARNLVDPAIVQASKRAAAIKGELQQVWKEKEAEIRLRLARSSKGKDESDLRQARSELTALEVRRSALRERLGQLRGEKANRLVHERDRLVEELGPDDPKVKGLDARISALDGDSGGSGEQENVRELLCSLEQVHRANLAMRSKLEERFKGDLEEAKKAEMQMLQESGLRNNLERQRTLFNAVVDQLKGIRMADDSTSVTSEVVEPVHLVPMQSRTAWVLLVALLSGTFLGACAAYGIELLDDRIRSCDELRAVLEFPMLGFVPLDSSVDGADGGGAGLVCLARPRSITSESFKSIRTNLDSCRRHRPAQVILLTSPRPGDGKSTMASNLAIAMAQAGRSVLLVDADLRRPVQHQVHDVTRDRGLVHALKRLLPLHHIAQPTAVPGLSLVASGPEIPDPSETLASPHFAEFLAAAREAYDVVIIDSPPLLAVTDPCIISVLVDGVVLVVRAGTLRRREASRVNEVLKSLGTPILGTVVNGFSNAPAGFMQGNPYIYGYGDTSSSSSVGGRRPSSVPGQETTATEGSLKVLPPHIAPDPLPAVDGDSPSSPGAADDVGREMAWWPVPQTKDTVEAWSSPATVISTSSILEDPLAALIGAMPDDEGASDCDDPPSRGRHIAGRLTRA